MSMANMLETNFDALIVSAGHTQAVKVRPYFLDVINNEYFSLRSTWGVCLVISL
jgi:hypothetical protein